jgi:hypothetical protein
MRFTRGWFSNTILADPGLPVVYWSKAIWDTWTPERQQEALGRVPNIGQWLR